jgi:5-methyltetrahydrofolate--homocysteine methyltransferase
VVERVRGREVAERTAVVEPSVASLYAAVPFRQDAGVLMVGERTNTNGSKAFREAMLAGDWEKVVDIGREAVREGAHLIDLCVDYVGRDGAIDMRDAASRLATASTLPIMLDSTEPPVIEAGLECLGGRPVINSVNFEDGEGPDSRFAKVMPIVREHGAAVVALTIDEEGQARTADWKMRVAERLIDTLTQQWGMRASDILVDFLTFTLATGQEESRATASRRSRPSAGCRRSARRSAPRWAVQHLLRPQAGRPGGAQLGLPARVPEGRADQRDRARLQDPADEPDPEDQRELALDLVYDRRREGYDPLTAFLEAFENVVEGAGPAPGWTR